MPEEIDLRKAAEIIKNSNYIVAFTGAGSSTESGIADFRSEGGLWSRYDPSIYANYQYFLKDPSKFWEMHNELVDILVKAEPNPIHHAIAKLEELGKVNAIITQNVDILHQRAGSGSFRDIPIYELHGSYEKLECLDCRKEFHFDKVDTHSVKYPICECGGLIKPKVVLFGESLPFGVLEGALQECRNCDCFIMVGSSLLVSPANLMPAIAKQYGARVIFINRDNTMMDHIADIFLKGNGGEILTTLMDMINSK
ncbi:MAG: NAD-dependent protein deacylase [Candidatus Hodarchaeota archaeon]